MKSLVTALSVLFVSCMALDAYSLTSESNSGPQTASTDTGAPITPDAGMAGVGEQP